MDSAGDAAAYREAWQTWTPVRRPPSEPPPAAPAGARRPDQRDTARRAEEAWRHRVQVARVDRQWSIAELGARVQCDVETLAAFERGDALLDEPARRRVAAALELA
jgi:ribosome-binding protein aMBF1 (putative translation factor)